MPPLRLMNSASGSFALFCCSLRKQTPVFGIIKAVMGFRLFLLRGFACVRGEWSLVVMAWNIKRM
jgi:Transposase DDE domain